MATLPDLNLLVESGLNGLEQYLAWALVEMRRLAIAEGRQQVVRLTMAIANVKKLDEDRFEGLLKTEVNLSYDSQIALADGLSFLDAIKDVSSAQAQLPAYVCSTNTNADMNEQIRDIAGGKTAIDTLEKLVYWLCLSWQKSKFSILEKPQDSSFVFFEENNDGGLVKFQLNIPLNYDLVLAGNIVCAAYQSPFRDPLVYNFARNKSVRSTEADMLANYDAGNDSNYGNDSEIGN